MSLLLPCCAGCNDVTSYPKAVQVFADERQTWLLTWSNIQTHSRKDIRNVLIVSRSVREGWGKLHHLWLWHLFQKLLEPISTLTKGHTPVLTNTHTYVWLNTHIQTFSHINKHLRTNMHRHNKSTSVGLNMNLTREELGMLPACTCQRHWASSWWNGVWWVWITLMNQFVLMNQLKGFTNQSQKLFPQINYSYEPMCCNESVEQTHESVSIVLSTNK